MVELIKVDAPMLAVVAAVIFSTFAAEGLPGAEARTLPEVDTAVPAGTKTATFALG